MVFIALGFSVPLAFPGYAIPFDPLGPAALALGLVGGAYMAETIRARIQAVPKGQMEAARSLGMSQSRGMISIVIPQAFRIILPPLTNELIAHEGLIACLRARLHSHHAGADSVRARNPQPGEDADSARRDLAVLPADHHPAVNSGTTHGEPSGEGSLT